MYGCFGFVCDNIGDFKVVINYYDSGFEIFKNLGDNDCELWVYNSFGRSYCRFGNF